MLVRFSRYLGGVHAPLSLESDENEDSEGDLGGDLGGSRGGIFAMPLETGLHVGP